MTKNYHLPPSNPDLQRAASRLKTLNGIFLHHRRIDLFEKNVRLLMLETQDVFDHNAAMEDLLGIGRFKPKECWVLPVIGPTGSTKSETIGAFCRAQAQTNSPDQVPFLVITLKDDIRSARALQVAILAGYEDNQDKVVKKDEPQQVVNDAIMNIARVKGTKLIILDEAHNMLAHDAGKIAPVMAKALRSLVNDAVFSLVLAGTDELQSIYNNQELTERCNDPVDFGPPPVDDTAACIEFFSFVQEFCREMHRLGVVDRPFNPLGSVHECAMLFDMTSGLMGQFVRLVRRALKRALLEGKTSLDWETLCLSYSAWRKLDKGLGRYDPLRQGAKANTVLAVRGMVGAPRP